MILDILVDTITAYLFDKRKIEYNPESIRKVIRNVLIAFFFVALIIVAAMIFNSNAEFKLVH